MTKKICLSMPVDLLDRLDVFCKQSHRKRATTIQWALNRFLDEEYSQQQPVMTPKVKQRQLEHA